MTVRNRQVNANNDCVARRLTPDWFGFGSVSLFAGAYDAVNYQYGVGIRFNNIYVPQGATITEAHLSFISRASLGGVVTKTMVSAEDVDNAPAFINDSAVFDARFVNHTAARINWDGIGAWTVNLHYESPDIASVIQEVVSRPGWVQGNSIVIFWEDFDDRSNHAGAGRDAFGYAGVPDQAPWLTITYGSAPTEYLLNAGLETGDFTNWTEADPSGSLSVDAVQSIIGTFNALFETGSANIRSASLAQNNAGLIANLRGKIVRLQLWSWVLKAFTGGPGSYWYIQLIDSLGIQNWTGNMGGSSVGSLDNILLSIVVSPAANWVQVNIVWYKSGGGTIYSLRIDADAGALIIAVAVTTQAVTGIMAATATGHGNITDLDLDVGPTQHGHCWSILPNPTIADSKTLNGVPSATGPFTSALAGLLQGTLYHTRSYVTTLSGTTYGEDVAFTTILIVLGTVITDPASLIGLHQADLNGTLDNDGGEACDCGFQWGLTSAYGNTTPTQSRVTGQAFAQTIIGLDRNKIYHFRSFATNSEGTSYGADRTLLTLTEAPIVSSDPVTTLGYQQATLNGTLNDDGGAACDCGFQWGKSVAYGGSTPTTSKTIGQTFSQALAPLEPGTVYHFRAFARNLIGIAYGADVAFRTYPSSSISYALGRAEL